MYLGLFLLAAFPWGGAKAPANVFPRAESFEVKGGGRNRSVKSSVTNTSPPDDSSVPGPDIHHGGRT